MNNLNIILQRITTKHKEFLKLKPRLPKELEKNLYEWFRIALTYTSNAIEGNTLTHAETADVVEKNITIPGKNLTEHLEAINHAEAIDFAKELSQVKTRKNITLEDILKIHECILQRINNQYAGKLRDVNVRIIGSTSPIPNHLKVWELMNDLVTWLHSTDDNIIKIAADSHLKLVFIHPFVDGNGRISRLLMNLILLQDNYPLVYIKVEDRTKYIKAIQRAVEYISSNYNAQEYILNSNNLEISEFQDYYKIIFESIEHSLDEYIKSAKESGCF